jgi:hypothetical protein
MNAAERAVAGAALAPLTVEQKRNLVLLARDAWARETHIGRARPPDAPPTNHSAAKAAEGFDFWRRRHCMMAVEKPGLTACRNEDYNPLRAHFLMLLGRKTEADRCGVRQFSDPRRQAQVKLEEECLDAADVLPGARAYAAGFLRNARKTSVEEADAKTLWHAIFVVRRRAAQLRKANQRGAA